VIWPLALLPPSPRPQVSLLPASSSHTPFC